MMVCMRACRAFNSCMICNVCMSTLHAAMLCNVHSGCMWNRRAQLRTHVCMHLYVNVSKLICVCVVSGLTHVCDVPNACDGMFRMYMRQSFACMYVCMSCVSWN